MKNDILSIKGTKNGLVLIFSHDADFDAAKNALTQKLNEAKGFFNTAKFNIVADHLSEQEQENLHNICITHGMIRDDSVAIPNTALAKEQIAASIVNEVCSNNDSLLLMKNIRSGQTIKYQGNVVIIGDVNPGAEVIADGNIAVLGKLRGVAHAGYSGNTDTFILAYRLQPTQLRIFNLVSRPPENEILMTYPEIARYSKEGIYIEKYGK